MELNEWIHLNHPECTHDNVLIFCYDIPAHNNSRVSVVYRNPNNDAEQYETGPNTLYSFHTQSTLQTMIRV